MSKKRKKIVRYRKPVHINIGVIFFAIVFIYFAIYLISYLSEDHISVYEVQKGKIAENDIYTGLVLRDEQVVYADASGVVNYYIKEGDKAKNLNTSGAFRSVSQDTERKADMHKGQNAAAKSLSFFQDQIVGSIVRDSYPGDVS